MSLGLHTCLKLRVRLYDRLGLQTDEPDFFLIFRQVNALCAWHGPEEHCPSARIKLPSQSKQISALAECRVQAEFQLALLQAHVCFILLSKFSPQPHLQNQYSALHLLGLLHLHIWSFHWVTCVVFLLVQLITVQLSRNRTTLKKCIDSLLPIHHKAAAWRNKSIQRKQ